MRRSALGDVGPAAGWGACRRPWVDDQGLELDGGHLEPVVGVDGEGELRPSRRGRRAFIDSKEGRDELLVVGHLDELRRREEVAQRLPGLGVPAEAERW